MSLISWPYSYFIKAIIGLVINNVVLIEREIVINFSK